MVRSAITMIRPATFINTIVVRAAIAVSEPAHENNICDSNRK
jgi:hypothetical protein